MNALNNMHAGTAVSRHDVWVCILLGLLLLYNPFLMLPGSNGGLNVRHPASNRATVGSSELQQFTSVAGQDYLSCPDIAPVETPFPLPAPSRWRVWRVSGELFPPQYLLCASLWNRPPPAR